MVDSPPSPRLRRISSFALRASADKGKPFPEIPEKGFTLLNLVYVLLKNYLTRISLQTVAYLNSIRSFCLLLQI